MNKKTARQRTCIVDVGTTTGTPQILSFGPLPFGTMFTSVDYNVRSIPLIEAASLTIYIGRFSQPPGAGTEWNTNVDPLVAGSSTGGVQLVNQNAFNAATNPFPIPTIAGSIGIDYIADANFPYIGVRFSATSVNTVDWIGSVGISSSLTASLAQRLLKVLTSGNLLTQTKE